MLLAIDIGNTRIKCALFVDHKMKQLFWVEHVSIESKIREILRTYPECKDIVVASVGNYVASDIQAIAGSAKCHFLNHQSAFPFQNKYETPKTLGIDRMVLAAGAVLLFPDTARLVIDAGTCITYDFIDKDNNYLGGAISPGIRIRYEALHQYTAKLPLLEKKFPDDFVGNSTVESIHSGVVGGTLNEIAGFIAKYEKRSGNIIIILTGGDSEFLAKQLKNTIFANSNFLLDSLNQIFQYQIKK